MKRRDFLLNASGLLSAAAFAPSIFIPRNVFAQTEGPILINVFLSGGPDFRHLFVPQPSATASSYSAHYWNARYAVHGVANSYSAWMSRYQAAYTPVSTAQGTVGIYNGADWLRTQFQAGNVAVVSNVLGSSNRDHHHSSLIYNVGDLAAGKSDSDRPGWGGRLAAALNANVVSVTSNVLQFGYSPHATLARSHSLDRVVPAQDTRDMGLYRSSALISNSASRDPRAVHERAISSYFAAKSVAAGSPFERFDQQESLLREFASQMESALSGTPIPEVISNLYSGTSTLNSTYFGQQVRNAFDAVVARSILDTRIISMEYRGWDTHSQQAAAIESNFTDLFSSTGGLARLTQELDRIVPGISSRIVFMIGGEFGRQISGNGDAGTDHGEGMTVLLISPSVTGGLYGEIFPTSEIADSSHGYLRGNADIEGRTSLEQIYLQVCNHFVGSSNHGIVPLTHDQAESLETAGLLNSLFS